jgi:hypothetical protein
LLADGRWGQYTHLTPRNGINSLFYWSKALGLYRHGRAGRAKYLALGDFNLSGLFFYSLPSLYMYWLAPIPVIYLGMFGWWLSHLVWVQSVGLLPVLSVMFLVVISTGFYGNLSLQNYNAIGWMFFPLGLYGLLSKNWIVAGIAWALASQGSVTVVALGGVFSFLDVFYYGSWYPLATIFPAALMVASHFWPSLIYRDLGKVVSVILKAIGFSRRSARYQREKMKKIALRDVYFVALHLQFVAFSLFLTGQIPYLLLVSVFVFLVNSFLFRFADNQSMYMMMLSVASCEVILNFHPFLLIPYWFFVSPLPKFLAFPTRKYVFDVVPELRPFDVHPVFEGMKKFLLPVRDGQRIMMAFDDPGNCYEKIFDGQRVLLELPLYISAEKEIHLFPDWSAVFELNYHGAPDIWGRDLQDVVRNVEYWRADCVVLYQNRGTQLESKWLQAGFHPLAKFSWSDYAEQMQDVLPIEQLPDWWLLKCPDR